MLYKRLLAILDFAVVRLGKPWNLLRLPVCFCLQRSFWHSHSETNGKQKGQREAGLITVLFFFSGFPALIYQIVWQRALFVIYGVNVQSVAVVVSAFMLGLGWEVWRAGGFLRPFRDRES